MELPAKNLLKTSMNSNGRIVVAVFASVHTNLRLLTTLQ
jgi:hypothetical protein